MNNSLSTLSEYVPDGSIQLLLPIIGQNNVKIIISRPRTTKIGDYRPPRKSDQHRITINGNLNKYAFIITLLHEIAHLKCWILYRNRVAPHGQEWKDEFRKLLIIFINKNIFPLQIKSQIALHIINKPAFSGNYKLKIEEVLENYNAVKTIRLKELAINDRFELRSGRQFIVLKKIRTRFLCLDIKNGKQYLISSVSEIKRKL